jgi:WD40 repeat protein
MNGEGNTWLDTAEFSDQIQACREHHRVGALLCGECTQNLESASMLYKGRFLDGFTLEGCQEFNQWAMVEAEHLHRLVVDVQTRLVANYQLCADIDRMGAHAKRWAVMDSYDEAAQRAMMLAYALNGQRGAALQQYDSFRQLMKDELGVELQVETRELYNLLLEDKLRDGIVFSYPLNIPTAEYSSTCPYRGLAAFREIDARFFFGRTAFVERLYQQLSNGSKIIGIVGPSGSGKSSVTFAGLLPRVREGSRWRILQMRPGPDPIRALYYAIADSEDNEIDSTIEVQADYYLDEIAGQGNIQSLLGNEGECNNLLTIIDQFEELFTLCLDGDVQRQFIDELLDAIKEANAARGNLIVLLTLRADFMSQALSYRPFADALQEMTLLLGPMNRTELRAAIEEPARIQGVNFESGLVERLLDDVGEEPGNLPLLEFALTLLWEQMENGFLTHSAYERIDCVDGALANYAEGIFTKLDEQEQENGRQIFVQLVRPGDGTEDTRRVATRTELSELSWPLVRQLADQRLIVTGRNQDGIETAEVAHEALIQKWGRLQDWMRVDRAFRIWQDRMRGNFIQWQRSGEDEGVLLRGAPLAEAEGWLVDHDYKLSRAELYYIQASIDLRERTMVQRDRRRKQVMTGLVFGFAVTLILLLLIWNQRQEARHQASIGLASQAVAELKGDFPERGGLLALEALEHYPYTWQAEAALAQAVLDGRLRGILPHDDYVNTAQWTGDGEYILSASSDGTSRLWNASTGEEIQRFTEGNPTHASMSPDEQSLLAVNIDETLLKVWDVPTGTVRYTLTQEELGPALFVTMEKWEPWSPASDQFLTYSVDGMVNIWDMKTGELVQSFRIQGVSTDSDLGSSHVDLDNVTHDFYFGEGDQALWSPDGKLIVTSSSVIGSVALWRVETGEMLYSIPGEFEDQNIYVTSWSPSGEQYATRGLGGVKVYDSMTGDLDLDLSIPGVYIYRAIWSPDGSYLLASGIDDGTARVFDTGNGKEEFQISNLLNATGSDWSEKTNQIAIAGHDGIIHIWDSTRRRELDTLYGTQPRILKVVFSPDGEKIFAIGDENSIKIYDLSEASLRIKFPIGPKNTISTVGWSPDGKRIAIGNENRTAMIWDATTGDEQVILRGHDKHLWYIGWSPDNEHFVSTSDDRTARIWKSSTGEMLRVFNGHQSGVMGAVWSPDGNRVASFDIDNGEVIIWDPNTGNELLKFSNHQDFIMWVAWSPDGSQILSTGAHGEAYVWDTYTGDIIQELYPDSYKLDVISAVWTKDGKRAYVYSADGIVNLFEVHSGISLMQFEIPRPSLSQFLLSPNESRILKGGVGGASVWDVKNGVEILTYDAPGWVDAAYSPDGKKILIGCNWGTLEIYPTWHSVDELVEYARDCCVIRDLTPEERLQFGLPPSKE